MCDKLLNLSHYEYSCELYSESPKLECTKSELLYRMTYRFWLASVGSQLSTDEFNPLPKHDLYYFYLDMIDHIPSWDLGKSHSTS